MALWGGTCTSRPRLDCRVAPPQRMSTWNAKAARIARPHSRLRAISIRVLTVATLAATKDLAWMAQSAAALGRCREPVG